MNDVPDAGRSPEALWTAMADQASDDVGWIRRRLDPSCPCELFCALKVPERTPALLLEVGAKNLPMEPELPTARGFMLNIERLSPGPSGHVRICLTLKKAEWRTVFEALVDDVAHRVLAEEQPARQARQFIERLRQWARFMERRKAEGLSLEVQLGLMAELEVLNRLVLPRLAAINAMGCWLGPLGGLHDFSFPSGALEVKGSSQLPLVQIEISSLAQLDETGVQQLMLAVASLEAGPNVVGESLPQRIQRIRDNMALSSPDAAAVFDERLLAIGYLDEERELYSGRRYNCRSVRLYRVNEDFPRLRVLDVPSGITGCRYTVSIGSCQRFIEDEEDGMRNLLGVENG